VHPIYGFVDVGAEVLVIEAVEEAPEASREQIAAAIEAAAPELTRKLQAQRMDDHSIAEVQGVIGAAVLELQADQDWWRRVRTKPGRN
jgi:hypothetical protein